MNNISNLSDPPDPNGGFHSPFHGNSTLHLRLGSRWKSIRILSLLKLTPQPLPLAELKCVKALLLHIIGQRQCHGGLYQVSSNYRSNRANRPAISAFPRVFCLFFDLGSA